MTATPTEPADIERRIAIAQIDASLGAVPVGGAGGLAVTTNRSFRPLVGLRIRTQRMALDLQAQGDIARDRAAAGRPSNRRAD